MSITLDQIRDEFPNANYAPTSGCQYCNGTGASGPKKIIVINKGGVETRTSETERQACVCVFVGGGVELHRLVIEGLAQIANDGLKALE